MACSGACSATASPMSSFRWRAGRPRSSACRPIFSSARTPAPMAQAFRLWRASVPAAGVEATVARYLGAQRTREAFETFCRRPRPDLRPARRGRHPPAAHRRTSARLGDRRGVRRASCCRCCCGGATSPARRRCGCVDDASAALLYNRDMLQHALDFARQGISVFDADLRLTCWNREFRDMFDLPAELHARRRGARRHPALQRRARPLRRGRGATNWSPARLERLTNTEPFRVPLATSGQGRSRPRSARMPDGGLVVTYTDVTEQYRRRTGAGSRQRDAGAARARAHRAADPAQRGAGARQGATPNEANISKTRFLAAAGHDILQPLNAARLYAATMIAARRRRRACDGDRRARAQCRFLAGGGGGYFLGACSKCRGSTPAR